MYRFKTELKEKVLDGRTITSVAEKLEINTPYLTDILNKKRGCSKSLAYYITKTLNETKEIEDYFERVI